MTSSPTGSRCSNTLVLYAGHISTSFIDIDGSHCNGMVLNIAFLSADLRPAGNDAALGRGPLLPAAGR